MQLYGKLEELVKTISEGEYTHIEFKYKATDIEGKYYINPKKDAWLKDAENWYVIIADKNIQALVRVLTSDTNIEIIEWKKDKYTNIVTIRAVCGRLISTIEIKKEKITIIKLKKIIQQERPAPPPAQNNPAVFRKTSI